jgi:hypothetical protein
MVTLAQPHIVVNLSFQGSYVRASVSDPDRMPVGGKRGKVTEFSPASRRRLQSLLQKMEFDGGVFMTLTYPAEFPSPAVAKKHLHNFFRKMSRLHPEASAIWRLEFQKRGAPHFHLMWFNLPYMPKAYLKKVWGQVIGYADPFTRIEWMQSRRGVVSYVSKYVAKVGGEAGGGFNLDAYLRGVDFVHPLTGELCGPVGRWWGVFNASKLPLAPEIRIAVSGKLAPFYQLRRGARRKWRGVSRRPTHGFSLFVDDADRWFEYWLHLVLSCS